MSEQRLGLDPETLLELQRRMLRIWRFDETAQRLVKWGEVPGSTELLGRRTGVWNGRGGSMQPADIGVGSLGEFRVVGSAIPVATVEAAKVTTDLEGPDRGVLVETLVPAGRTVEIYTPLAILETN